MSEKAPYSQEQDDHIEDTQKYEPSFDEVMGAEDNMTWKQRGHSRVREERYRKFEALGLSPDDLRVTGYFQNSAGMKVSGELKGHRFVLSDRSPFNFKSFAKTFGKDVLIDGHPLSGSDLAAFIRKYFDLICEVARGEDGWDEENATRYAMEMADDANEPTGMSFWSGKDIIDKQSEKLRQDDPDGRFQAANEEKERKISDGIKELLS